MIINRPKKTLIPTNTPESRLPVFVVNSSNTSEKTGRQACTGCQACVSECPYGAIQFNEVRNVAEKCNMCFHRIDQGLEPFCVLCCEEQAIYFEIGMHQKVNLQLRIEKMRYMVAIPNSILIPK